MLTPSEAEAVAKNANHKNYQVHVNVKMRYLFEIDAENYGEAKRVAESEIHSVVLPAGTSWVKMKDLPIANKHVAGVTQAIKLIHRIDRLGRWVTSDHQ